MGATWRASVPGYYTEYNHITGRRRPMREAKDCASYLGIHVAERVLSKFFGHIERMPPNNPGYDFVCGKGFKIDCKSACICFINHKYPTWKININKNELPDFFLCIGFDNREDLTPLHVWLIPGADVNMFEGIGISNTEKSLAKWSKYERPLDKVLFCCEEIRNGDKI